MIGVGIIGVGMVADIHYKALRDIQDVARIAAVYDRDEKRLAEFCKIRDLPQVNSIEKMLADPEVHAVILLTPPNVRKGLVEQAAAAGKHVLMEKPMERNTAAAEELAEIAAKAGITLGVVFQHRFRAASRKLKQVIEDGLLGELASATATVPWWRPQSYYDEPGRGTYARDGGGVLINQAIHTLDLLLSFTGPVTSLSAMMGTTRLHRMEAEDFVVAGVRFASGAMGAITATTAAFPGGAESITLEFDLASARLESGVLELTYHDGRKESFGEPAGTGGGADPMAFPHDWHASAQRDFFEALAAGRQPEVNAAEALKVHRLIDAMTVSSREERAVRLDQ
jgi:UDP-N-acetyl-2-amino-2-deoxyglucuronate dehydrogenase